MRVWPGVVGHALLHPIPKPEGGRRPTGLVDDVCRLWEFAHRPVMREWRASFHRDYDYGAKGCTSIDAMWRQALCDEAVATRGAAAATTLIDLCKVFKSVPLEHVWRWGLVMGINPIILRPSSEICSFSRHLTLHWVAVDGVLTLSVFFAGISFATDEMFTIMAEVRDDLQRVWLLCRGQSRSLWQSTT